MDVNKSSLKHKNLIIIISIIIPLAIALLFRIRLENTQSLYFLPPIYAAINGYTAIILMIAFWAIKKKKILLHKQLMKIALALSFAFLIMYVAYHITSEPTTFGGEGTIKYIYYIILLSHILLSLAVVPLVLISFVRGASGQFKQHRKIARITLPIWLYVTITGVVVYFMIKPYYI